MKRHATSIWKGTVKEGIGSLSSQSGTLTDTPYSFAGRFTDESGKKGTNPEELIAAPHAGCFNMALSNMLTEAGYHPAQLKKNTMITVDNEEEGIKITSNHLDHQEIVEGVEADIFEVVDNQKEEHCTA